MIDINIATQCATAPLHIHKSGVNANHLLTAWIKQIVGDNLNPTPPLLNLLETIRASFELSELRTGALQELVGLVVYRGSYRTPKRGTETPPIHVALSPDLPATPFRARPDPFECLVCLKKADGSFCWQQLSSGPEFHLISPENKPAATLPPNLLRQIPFVDLQIPLVICNVDSPVRISTPLPNSQIAEFLQQQHAHPSLNSTASVLVQTLHHLNASTPYFHSDLYYIFTFQQEQQVHAIPDCYVVFSFEISQNTDLVALFTESLLLALLAYQQFCALSALLQTKLRHVSDSTPSDPQSPRYPLDSPGHHLRWIQASFVSSPLTVPEAQQIPLQQILFKFLPK